MGKPEQEDEFMKVFKYYKSNRPQPSLRDVLTLSLIPNNNKVFKNVTNNKNDMRSALLGLKSFCSWQSYSFHDHPGLFLIKNPFTGLGQRYWIRQCLELYPRKPNKTNIDHEMIIEDWWQKCHEDGKCNQQVMKKLRWSTLGYHHNWDTKEYSEDNKSKFPEDLAELAHVVACFLSCEQFKPEAAIVNYYHMKSTLSAHTDHSEVNLEAPLFSFSFGQSAIFLIGGQDKSFAPTPILLESGDIMVMSKEARLCYHAVPRILPSSLKPWNDEIMVQNFIEFPNLKYIENTKEFIVSMNRNLDDVEWARFGNYVEESRINMNVRQVLNENQSSLIDPVFITSS